MIVLLLSSILVLVAIGVPMFAALMIPTLLSLCIYAPNIPLTIIVQQFLDVIKISSLLAVPMFIFAAEIMNKGKLADNLINLFQSWAGHIRGGLGISTVTSCTLFGAVSGSTQATVASIGKVMHPRLMSAGYRDSFTMGLIINSSDVANLIPPSITMIIYGIVVRASIGELFIAGIVPGALICLIFSLYVYLWARHNDIPVSNKSTIAQRWKAAKEAKWACGLPVIIIGGIYGGIFSPTEAAAVSAVYALLIEVFVVKNIKLSQVPAIALSAAKVNVIVFVLIGGAQVLSWYLTISGMPQAVATFIIGLDLSKINFLLLVNILFFIACMLINPAAVLLILSPLIFPIAMQYGVDPIHLGVIITMQIAIGSATPPFGIDIFTACAVFDKKYGQVVKGTWPFVLLLFGIALLVTLFPALSLFLRDFVFGR